MSEDGMDKFLAEVKKQVGPYIKKTTEELRQIASNAAHAGPGEGWGAFTHEEANEFIAEYQRVSWEIELALARLVKFESPNQNS